MAYKTKQGAKAAVKRQGLHLMKFYIQECRDGFHPVFYVHDECDRMEIEDRGFSAIINPNLAA